MADDGVVTNISGTFVPFEIGAVMLNRPFEAWGEKTRISFKVLRESNEQEYRDKYNYRGPIPIDPLGRKAYYYEIVALD